MFFNKKNIFFRAFFLSLTPFLLNNCGILPFSATIQNKNPEKTETEYLSFIRTGNNFKMTKASGFSLNSATRYEENDPAVQFVGNWQTINNEESSNGSFLRNDGRKVYIVEQDSPSVTYILPENWTTVNDSRSSGGSYSFNDGKPATFKQDTDSSITYTGNWSSQSIGNETFQAINASEGSVIDQNTSENTNLKYSPDNWLNHISEGFNAHYAEISDQTTTTLGYNHQDITYTGNDWQTAKLNNISLKSSSGRNLSSSVSINFSGNNLNIGVIKGFDRGIVKVSLYDQTNTLLSEQNVDLYEARIKTDFISINQLQSSNYKVVISPTGTKNQMSSGFRFDFIKAYNMPAGLRWIGLSTPFYNGVGWKGAVFDQEPYIIQENGLPGSNYLEFNFSGTNISARFSKGNDKGLVKISVFDSNNNLVKQRTEDLFSPIPDFQEFSFNALPLANYKVKIEPTGTKNAAASGYGYGFVGAFSLPAIEYNFTEENIIYQAMKGPTGGMVDITLDGDPATTQTIDLYSSSNKNEAVKAFTKLTNASHRITVELKKQKNPLSSGYRISLDSFNSLAYVSGSVTGGELIIGGYKGPNLGKFDVFVDNTFKQTVDLYSSTLKKEVIYSQKAMTNQEHTFKLVANPDKNNNSSGDLVGFDFVGTGLPSFIKQVTGSEITIYGNKGPTYGKVNIYLNMNSPFEIDLYSPTYQYNQPIMTTGFNVNSNHFVKVEQTFTKNENSAGYEFACDATGIETPKAIISFTGTDFTLYGNKGPGMGAAAVNLDGNFEIVDLYSANQEYNVPLKTYTNVTPGQHVLSYSPIFGKNDASSGFEIDFDGFEFQNDYQPVISSFNPGFGGPEDTITITGSKFSKTLSENTLKINGVETTIISVNDTTPTPTDDPAYPAEFAEEIVIKLPFGISQGKMQITTTKGGSFTTAEDFLINFAPHAVLKMSPMNGTTSTSFTADTSLTTDEENNNLQFKFDWGDGSDTGFTNNTTASKTYSSNGYKLITLTVKDSFGVERKTTQTIYVGTQTSGWQTKASLVSSRARRNGVAINVNGKIYLIGGNNNGVLEYLDEYDPVANTWTVKTNMPFAAQLVKAAEYNNQVLVYAGQLLFYNPETDTWKGRGNNSIDPITRGGAEMGLIGNKLYFAGGTDNSGNVLKNFNSYNLLTDQWETLPDLPLPNFGGASGVINGKFYITTGFGSGTATMCYDPATNSWTTLTPIPAARAYPHYSVVNDQLYVAGGQTGSTTFLKSVHIYNPVNDEWSVGTDIPTSTGNVTRYSGQAATIANEFYSISGRINTTNLTAGTISLVQ